MRRTLFGAGILALSFVVAACSQSKRTDTPPPTDEKAAALATAIELTPAKIVELGQVAALMEKDTAMRATILQQHGFTQEQMDQALAKIVSDPAMMAQFQEAKKAAIEGAANVNAGETPTTTQASTTTGTGQTGH